MYSRLISTHSLYISHYQTLTIREDLVYATNTLSLTSFLCCSSVKRLVISISASSSCSDTVTSHEAGQIKRERVKQASLCKGVGLPAKISPAQNKRHCACAIKFIAACLQYSMDYSSSTVQYSMDYSSSSIQYSMDYIVVVYCTVQYGL